MTRNLNSPNKKLKRIVSPRKMIQSRKIMVVELVGANRKLFRVSFGSRR